MHTQHTMKAGDLLRCLRTERKAQALVDSTDGKVWVQWVDSGEADLCYCEDFAIVLYEVDKAGIFLHNVCTEEVELLEQTFAKFTEQGWVFPEWISLLR